MYNLYSQLLYLQCNSLFFLFKPTNISSSISNFFIDCLSNTTTLSLLTAWSWNNLLAEFINVYYGKNVKTLLITAIFITTLTFLFINYILTNFRINYKNVNKVERVQLKNYVIDGMCNKKKKKKSKKYNFNVPDVY